MKNKFLLIILLLFSIHTFAVDDISNKTVVENINESVNEIMQPITETVESIVFFSFKVGDNSIPFVLVWLILGALFFYYLFQLY